MCSIIAVPDVSGFERWLCVCFGFGRERAGVLYDGAIYCAVVNGVIVDLAVAEVQYRCCAD